MSKVVGVTGGIAGGKSLFVSYLAEMGAETISADAIARNLLETGTEPYNETVATFGNDILSPDKAIDRAALGDLIFNSETAREALNSIIHPRVIQQVGKRIEDFHSEHANDGACLAVEVPLLFECNMQGLFDITVVVTVEQAIQICRLTHIRGISHTQAIERIASQMSESVKCGLADVVILNDGSVDELREKASVFATEYRIFCR